MFQPPRDEASVTQFLDVCRQACLKVSASNLAGIYLVKLKNGDTGRICEISSEWTTKTSQRHSWSRSDFFIANFEQILQVTLVFPLLSLNKLVMTRKGTDTSRHLPTQS